MNIAQKIAAQLAVNINQVMATITLLDEGATVPFIARYRKEVTGGLDDTQLRQLEEQLIYLRELVERRDAILKSVEEQGKLSKELEQQLMEADTKSRLEDLYAPYKPKRVTKAQIAREAGLEPLADSLLKNPALTPLVEAENYINPEKEIQDAAKALEGARFILIERFAEHADLIKELRDYFWAHAVFHSEVKKGKEESGIKFKDYFAYQESLEKIPSHRALAVFRGAQEEYLDYKVNFASDDDEKFCLNRIASVFDISQQQRPADAWLWQVIELTWKARLRIKLEVDLVLQLRERAEDQAIHVFRDNLKNLLMVAPAGKKNTLGLDPGLRTGVKVVAVDDTGKLLTHTVIFPHAPQNQWDAALDKLRQLCEQYRIDLISIGNGTASRETERLVKDLLQKYPSLKMTPVVVSEAGASVYSASELAAKEFPDLDVSYRGAVSIARRLQDPLAELVKIDPKSIGVGQYQHDVNATKLSRNLSAVVEDCVNAVGVDINTASVPLLKNIAGLNETIAKNIVQYREQHGRFNRRDVIKSVPRLGDKSYEQAVGFLRIIGGENPLDASAVHPESYPVVEKILATTKLSLPGLLGDTKTLNALRPDDFTSDQFGRVTVADIISELKKPGRDPRPEFKTVQYKDGVEKISDLQVDMLLEGVVTNVANFGAFVDIGVHQDGLVHISQLANTFVDDPHKVVKVGQIVKVKVLEVDSARKRIQLTMKLEGGVKKEVRKAPPPKPTSGFADLLQKALR
jgi:uncharacterized protein